MAVTDAIKGNIIANGVGLLECYPLVLTHCKTIFNGSLNLMANIVALMEALMNKKKKYNKLDGVTLDTSL